MVISKSVFFRQVVSSSGTKVLLILFSMIQGIIIARELLPEGRGLIALILVTYQIIQPLADLGIKQSSAYFLSKEGYSVSSISILHGQLLSITTLFSFFILVGLFYFQGLIENHYFEFIFLMLSIPLRTYSSYTNSLALSNRWIDKINISQILVAFADLMFVILFFVIFDLEVKYYFIGFFIVSILLSIYSFSWAKKVNGYRLKNFIDVKNVKNNIKVVKKGVLYALPLFIFGINYKIDVIILNYYVDLDAIGLYTLGTSLAGLLWQVPAILSMIIFSYSVSHTDNRAFSTKLWLKTKLMMLYLLPILLIIGLFVEPMIVLLYGEPFTQSASVLYYLLPGVYIMIAFKMLNGDLAGRGFPQIALFTFFFGALLNVFLNIFLIPRFGIEGAAIASSISYIVCSVYYIFQYKNITFKEDK